MFQFTIFTDDSGLAVTFSLLRGNAQGLNRPLPEETSQFSADLHQWLQVLDIGSGEGIGDNGNGSRPARRWIDVFAHFDMNFIHHGDDLANLRFSDFCLAHFSPSSPLISATSSPPERLWTRGPVLITRI